MSTARVIGRGSELRQLGGLLDRVRAGGGALVVRGESGIGKSAMPAEAVRLATAQQLRILATTGVQSESQIAYAGLYQLLRPVLDQLDRLPAPQRNAVLAAFGRTDTAVPDLYLIALATLSSAAVSPPAPARSIASSTDIGAVTVFFRPSATWPNRTNAKVVTDWLTARASPGSRSATSCASIRPASPGRAFVVPVGDNGGDG